MEYTVSSGNVFADLGFDEPDEELAKADILIQLADAMMARGLTQARAAEMLGIDQPTMSALLSGNVEGCSLERLIRLLLTLDRIHPLRARENLVRSASPGTMLEG